MRKADKAVITTAVTGSVNVPSQSPHIPLSAQQVAESALEAADAGSAVVHLHARRPDGRPTADPDVFEEILQRITPYTDAVINITTGGSSAMTMEERLAAPVRIQPELASLNMGSMNFVYAGIADKVTTWRHHWEKAYVLNTYSQPFINTFESIEHTLRTLGALGTRFEYECYMSAEPGRVRAELHLVTAGGEGGEGVVVAEEPVGDPHHVLEVVVVGADATEHAEDSLDQQGWFGQTRLDEVGE